MDRVKQGQRLRELREAAGLLQRQVGAEFDIDKAAVSEWERGKSSPDRKKLVRLDELYDAGGEVLEIYGVGRADDIAGLRAEVTELRSLVAMTQPEVDPEISLLRAELAELKANVRELGALVRERLRMIDERGDGLAPRVDGANDPEPPAGEDGQRFPGSPS